MSHVTRRLLLAGAGAGAVWGLTKAPGVARFAPDLGDTAEVSAGDLAVLRFLAAAELLEDDLWQQYAELATDHPGFRTALSEIDPALPRYVRDDRDDERSHAALINGVLAALGEEPIDLDGFRTLPSVAASGAQEVGRLTNLTNLTVDTSWFNRYRAARNPDLGAEFAQLVTIESRPTVPTADGLSADQLRTIAHSAAFHFGMIEQGGGSLYATLLSRVRSPLAVRILAAIGPTEIYHFAAFHKSLEHMGGWAGDGIAFPDLRSDPETAYAIFPEPTQFLSADLPLGSIVRPTTTETAGAVATATALVASGLFEGQTPAFFEAVTALATAADAANRG